MLLTYLIQPSIMEPPRLHCQQSWGPRKNLPRINTEINSRTQCPPSPTSNKENYVAPITAVWGLTRNVHPNWSRIAALIGNVTLALSPGIYSKIQMLRWFSEPGKGFQGKLSVHASKQSLGFLCLKGELGLLDLLSASFRKDWPRFHGGHREEDAGIQTCGSGSDTSIAFCSLLWVGKAVFVASSWPLTWAWRYHICPGVTLTPCPFLSKAPFSILENYLLHMVWLALCFLLP